MRDAIVAPFLALTSRFEGTCGWLYLDVLGLVTTGRGNLVDPFAAAANLPWQRPDGTDATYDEIRGAWEIVKSRRDLCQHGGAAYAPLTTIRLSAEAVDDLTLGKLRSNDSTLAARFPGWADLPACVQLATHLLAWACGPAFRFPRLAAAINVSDWGATIAEVDAESGRRECEMDPKGNPGLLPRNAAIVALFAFATVSADPDALPVLT